MTIILLQIIGFHNCEGCSRKVRNVLRRIGVELLELDRESGNVTISTDEHPEVIRSALARQLKKSVIILSRDLVPTNQIPNSIVSHQVPANQALDLQEIVFRLSQVLDGVEITNSNTTRINFIRRVNPPVVMTERGGHISVQISRDADVEYPPPRSPSWVPTEPSAPLMPMAGPTVYGYPPEYYGIPTTRNRDDANGCCTIF